MGVVTTEARLSGRIADGLYTEALLLADEMRAYFEADGRDARDTLTPLGRVQYACESLKSTTRLMHVIAWLAAVRAGGEVRPELGAAPASERPALAALPTPARRLVLAGIDLHERVSRLARGVEAPVAANSPARVLIQRLERAF